MSSLNGGRGGDFLFTIPSGDSEGGGPVVDPSVDLTDWDLNYDESGDLQQVTRVESGAVIDFIYNDDGDLVGVVDGVAGRTYNLEYENGELTYVQTS